MKKFLLSCVLISSAAFLFSAENPKNFDWGYSLGAGNHTGQTHEYVYYASGDTESRLDWETYISPVIQLSGNMDFFHVILDADFYDVIPLKVGSMEDWDWLKSDHTRATNYSWSPVTINKDYQFNVKTGYEFLFGSFRILPEAGFKYRNKKFEANGGYYQYGSFDTTNDGYWAETLEKQDLYGTVITYEAQYFMPYAYLDVEYSFLENWTARLYGSYIPYIKSDAIDFHCADVNKLEQYNDFMDKGYGFTVGMEIRFKSFSLSAEYEWLKCDSGHSTIRDISSTSNFTAADTTPGIESSILTIMAAYKIK